jgi:hypothetical protein
MSKARVPMASDHALEHPFARTLLEWFDGDEAAKATCLYRERIAEDKALRDESVVEFLRAAKRGDLGVIRFNWSCATEPYGAVYSKALALAMKHGRHDVCHYIMDRGHFTSVLRCRTDVFAKNLRGNERLHLIWSRAGKRLLLNCFRREIDDGIDLVAVIRRWTGTWERLPFEMGKFATFVMLAAITVAEDRDDERRRDLWSELETWADEDPFEINKK